MAEAQRTAAKTKRAAANPKAKPAGTAKTPAKTPARAKRKSAKKPAAKNVRQFLAPQIGGEEGAGGVNVKQFLQDPKLRQVGLNLVRQFLEGGAKGGQQGGPGEMNLAALWKPDETDVLDTSSTIEEINSYRHRLEFRATFLEAFLEETLAQLEDLQQFLRAPEDVAKTKATSRKPAKQAAPAKNPAKKAKSKGKTGSSAKSTPAKQAPAKKARTRKTP